MTLILKWRKQRDSSLLCCHKKQQWQQKRQKKWCVHCLIKKSDMSRQPIVFLLKRRTKTPIISIFFLNRVGPSSMQHLVQVCSCWWRLSESCSVGVGSSINFIMAGPSKRNFQFSTLRNSGGWEWGGRIVHVQRNLLRLANLYQFIYSAYTTFHSGVIVSEFHRISA